MENIYYYKSNYPVLVTRSQMILGHVMAHTLHISRKPVLSCPPEGVILKQFGLDRCDVMSRQTWCHGHKRRLLKDLLKVKSEQHQKQGSEQHRSSWHRLLEVTSTVQYELYRTMIWWLSMKTICCLSLWYFNTGWHKDLSLLRVPSRCRNNSTGTLLWIPLWACS